MNTRVYTVGRLFFSNQYSYPSRMGRITIAIFIACCYFLVTVNGYANCGIGIWAGTSCIPLSKCSQYSQPMEQLYHSNTARHRSFLANRVRPAMCGFERDSPMVCCPNGFNSKTPEPQFIANRQFSCGNILWHKSLSPDGMPAELEEFSWLALLEYETETGRKYGCGGVLISDRHVLTAAHCLNLEQKLTRVRLGEHDLRTAQDCINDPLSPYCSKTAIDVGIEREATHENYSHFWGASDFDTLSYDVAVIKLDRPVISDVIKPICLPDQFHPSENKFRTSAVDVVGKFLSAGWGVLQNTVYPKSLVKLMSRLKGVNKNFCNAQYGNHLKDDIICALSKSPTTACIADNGGPLMGFNAQSKMTVTGIYSPVGSQSCRQPGVPSTFVDVRRYVDWIRMQMRY